MALDRRGGGGEGPARHAGGRAVHRPLPGHIEPADASAARGLAGLGGRAALLQPVPADLHHPVRGADPQPTTPGCTGRGTARPGKDWFRDPEAGARRSAVDGEAGLHQPAGQVGLPGIRHSIGLARWWHLGTDTLWLAERARLLRPVVRDRAVAAAGADELGGVPQRRCRC